MNFRYALNFAKVMRTGQPSSPYAMKQESDKILLYQASSGGVYHLLWGQSQMLWQNNPAGWLNHQS